MSSSERSRPLATSLGFAVLVFVATVVAACSGAASPTVPADLIAVGGNIHTSDPGRPIAEALAVRGGRFVAVGSADEISELAGPNTAVVELDGVTVLPGLIDGHVHLGSGSSLMRGVNLYGIADRDEWLEIIAAKAASLPAGSWIVGGSWDHTLVPGAPLPVREELDAVTPDHPVALSDVDGHSTWANSLALEIAGVDASTPDPTGGEIVRDPVTGEPTGILLETAGRLVNRHITRMTPGERDQALRDTLRYANSLGLTGVHDMSGNLQAYAELAERGALTLRVWFGRTAVSPDELPRIVELRDEIAARTVSAEAERGPTVALGYLKYLADGVLSVRTAALLAPYADSPEETGLPRYTQEELNTIVAAGNAAGFPVAIHAIGDRAIQMSLDAFEASPSPPPLANRIEHIEVVDPTDAPRFAELNVLASMNPHHCITGIDVYNTLRLGPSRAAWSFAWNRLKEAGATLVFGSDWNTAPLDPLRQLYAAVLREKPGGGPPGGWYPENSVSFEEALFAYTQSPANASGWGDQIGSITPGKWADFVILDGLLPDPLDRNILERTARATYLAGQVVYSAG